MNENKTQNLTATYQISTLQKLDAGFEMDKGSPALRRVNVDTPRGVVRVTVQRAGLFGYYASCYCMYTYDRTQIEALQKMIERMKEKVMPVENENPYLDFYMPVKQEALQSANSESLSVSNT